MYVLPGQAGDRGYGAESLTEFTFDWIMAPVAGLSDAFFGLLHMRLPDYTRRPGGPGLAGGPASTAATGSRRSG
ncbi:hypothetical protein [Rugosimonospora africana]|uniref:Uncharacterized protein n=1 Tax=Rugosimonospora africana TaxID=556532 RepID=A0A8J3VVB4_9ACTN|nr:hypothetical protein [Rugosimonospora africana]GIH20110.1 hypothetical protein Raf01_82820 [Rugosimonospora africana]